MTSLSLTSAIFFGINGNVIACVLWAISVIISIIYFASRSKEYDADADCDLVSSTKSYFATLTRKYNLFLLVVVGAILGVVGLLVVDKTDFLKGLAKYYVIGGLASACFVAAVQPIFSRKTKVSWIDACLVMALMFVVFGFGYLVRLKNDSRMLRFLFCYLISGLSLGFTILIRSVFCDSNVSAKLEKKSFSNYLGLVCSKYNVSVPLLCGVIAGGSASLVTRYGRIMHMFNNKRSSFFAILGIVIVAITLLTIFVGMVKKGYSRKDANILDVALLTSFVGGICGLGMIYVAFSYQRLTLVLVPVLFSFGSMLIRCKKVDVVSQTAVEKDESIIVDVKLVVDGDEIKAYCEGAEIEVNVVNKEEKVEAAPVVEETPVVETTPVAEEAPVASDDDDDEVVEVVDAPAMTAEEKLIIAKRSFENKIKFASPKAKYYYNELKNALMVYKTKCRVSKKAEAFRKNGLIAKLSVSGKSIRVHLALDPKAYDEGKYHHDDLGAKRAFKEVPFTMKIRSDLACKRAIELIDELAATKGLKANKKYERFDYAQGLDIDGAAILEKLGLLDQLTDVATKQQAENLTDEVLNFIPTVTLSRPLNEDSENVYIDTALKYVEDTISADTLHAAHQIPSTVEIINVKARTGLDKKITVYADEIDPLAAKLVLLTGGKVFKVVRK